MGVRISPARGLLSVALLVAAGAASPGWGAQARLVHCGDGDTCVRLSGRRAHPAVAIEIGGQALPVAGGRSWRADVPLADARRWPGVARDQLALVLADARTGDRRSEVVPLPPGALAGRVQLAELVIGAR